MANQPSNLMNAEQLLRFERKWKLIFSGSACVLIAAVIYRVAVAATTVESYVCYAVAVAALGTCWHAATKLADPDRMDSVKDNHDHIGSARAHPANEFASKTSLALADLANARLAPQFWGPDCDALIAQIRSHRKPDSPIHAVQPSSTAIDLALDHGFITFMPEMAVTKHLADGRLVRLDVVDLPPSHWEVMVAWRSGKRASAANKIVLDVVRAMAAEWPA